MVSKGEPAVVGAAAGPVYVACSFSAYFFFFTLWRLNQPEIYFLGLRRYLSQPPHTYTQPPDVRYRRTDAPCWERVQRVHITTKHLQSGSDLQPVELYIIWTLAQRERLHENRALLWIGAITRFRGCRSTCVCGLTRVYGRRGWLGLVCRGGVA